MHLRPHYFLVYFNGRAISSDFRRFLKNAWCFIEYISFVFNLSSPTILCKIFEVKLKNQAKLG